MTQQEQIIRRSLELIGAHDLDAFAAILSADARATSPFGDISGPDEVRTFVQTFLTAVPDLEHEIESLDVAGDVVTVRIMHRGTHDGPMVTPSGAIPPSGRTVAWPACHVYRLRDGRIAENHIYCDRLSLLEQLGAAPVPA